MAKATATTVTNNSKYVAKITVEGSVTVTAGLTAKDRDLLLHDLIQTLPSDHHIRQYMHI